MFDMKEWCKSLSNAIMTNYCDFKNISGQDLEELYKWIDIKKDIAEAEYYEAAKMKELSIVEAMENSLLAIWHGKIKVLPSGLKSADAAVLGAAALGWKAKE